MARTKQIGLRLTEDEYARLMEVFHRAEERTYGYATISDVAKELMGLRPLRVVTEEEREYLSGSGVPTLAEGQKPPTAARPGDKIRVRRKPA